MQQRPELMSGPLLRQYSAPALWKISELHRHGFYLCCGKDRAVLADIDITHIAAAAFSQAALHPVLQRGVDLFVAEAELLQHRQGELDHDRRPADERDRVLRFWRRLFENRR